MPRLIRSIFVGCSFVLMAFSVRTQTFVDTEKVLFPIVLPGTVPGANGSLWSTNLRILNNSESPVVVRSYPSLQHCAIPTGCSLRPPQGVVTPLPPQKSFIPRVSGTPQNPGVVLELEPSSAARIRFSLRVQDLSRQSATWGTQIPVVRERDFTSSGVDLIDIPVAETFRTTLRIYEIDPSPAGAARVQIFAIDDTAGLDHGQSDRLLGDMVVALQSDPERGRYAPGYAQLNDEQFLDRSKLFPRERLRLHVAPVAPTLRVWAFVSATNNETQHVTIVSPQ